LIKLLLEQVAHAPRFSCFRLAWHQFVQEGEGGTEKLSASGRNPLLSLLLVDQS
jgi:hypothetical protein